MATMVATVVNAAVMMEITGIVQGVDLVIDLERARAGATKAAVAGSVAMAMVVLMVTVSKMMVMESNMMMSFWMSSLMTSKTMTIR